MTLVSSSRWRSFAAQLSFAALLAAPSIAFAQVDSDRDGVLDAIDSFPCDAAATAQAFAPGEGAPGLLLFEDQWPSAGDLDFNDLALSYNYFYRLNASGRVVGLTATYDLLAIGGLFDNGLGLRLPGVAASAASSIVRRVGEGPQQPLTASATDTDLTVMISPNVRELFRWAPNQINSLSTQDRRAGDRLVVEITFSTPVQLPISGAPHDVYIFRADNVGHEIHRPQFRGTSQMNTALFGTMDDGTSPSRAFVDRDGLPFVLALPITAAYPREATEISLLYPAIIQFASSGGTSNTNFYMSPVAQHAFVDAKGDGAIAPAAIVTPARDHNCRPPVCTDTGETISCGTGACSVTVPACHAGHENTCTPGQPVNESCNGRDDDCDGTTDETCTCVVGTTRPCYNGAPGTENVGACRGGTQTCNPSGWGACAGAVNPTAESCNGRDDDCDGSSDEELAALTCGRGVCATTQVACVNGVAQTCTPLPSSPESCDGLDNDCDGATDEGLGNLTCGTGACGRTIPACSNGMAMTCQPGTPGTETCDNVDNDCDGTTDNNNAASSCTGFANATAACVNGNCQLGSCNTAYRSCDNNSSNGCEINTANNANNCGACGVVCASGVCNNGACGCLNVTCGDACGIVQDGCGGSVDCGPCAAPSIATGNQFSCALHGNGTARCWGANDQGQLGNGTTWFEWQPVAVTGLTNATGLAVGDTHACALRNDGTIRCWGYNGYGQLGDGTTTRRLTPVTVAGINTAVNITAGRYHTCATLANGTARCWGYNGNYQLGDGTASTRTTPVAVSGLTNVTSMAGGDNHTCARLADGTARCWGYNGYGQVGDGTTNARPTPVAVTGVTTVVAIAAAPLGNTTCVVQTAGTMRCWGDNSYGQIGDNTTSTRYTSTAVSGITTAADVTIGAIHTCARLQDGTVRCWGYNGTGSLGDNTTTQRNTSVAVTGLTDTIAVAAGYRHTCAMRSDGTSWCWGNNTAGELGDQTTIMRPLPTQVFAFPCGGGGTSNVCGACVPTTCAVQGLTAGSIADECNGTLMCGGVVRRLDTGTSFSCGILPSGAVQCWGDNSTGQLGLGNTTARYQPTTVPGLTNAVSVATGESHACVALSDGTVRCWGNNSNGQVGDGTTNQRNSPSAVGGILNAVEVTAGRYHSCARLADGSARCWGYNGNGQLGDGSTTQRLTPVAVARLSNVAAISGGNNHTCAVLTTGIVRCWGTNGNGQLGNGTTSVTLPVSVPGIANAIDVSASRGGNHSCAVLADGTTRCWGLNNYGQLGDGTTTSRTTPITPTGVANAISISAGANHTCATLSTGALMCWGYNASGQIGDATTTNRSTPVTLANVSGAIGVSASTTHTCTMMADGSAMCWGANNSGELGDESTYAHVAPAPVYSFPCTPTTCSAQGVGSGSMPNGCGQTIFCGDTAPRVSSGQNFSCSVLSTGVPMCWGTNANAQLGNGTTMASWSPVAVSGINTATSVVTGESHACALLANGTIRCWGYNGYGQIGDGTTTQRPTSVLVSGITNATGITAGRYHTCARLVDGTARCWGYNGNYQLGDGTSSTRNVPTAVTGLSGFTAVTAIAAGDNHTCALLSGGSVRCWGYNGYGQLGDGTSGSRPTPQNVTGINNAVDITASTLGNHTCAVLSTGAVRCWGDNSYGQLGDNTTSTRYTPVATIGITNAVEVSGGNIHTCARLVDNTVRCWGYNGTGSIGDNTTTQRNSSVAVTGLTDVTHVSAGYRHTCAAMADGTTRCWGNNTSGELGDETTIQRNTSVLVAHFPCTAGTSNMCTSCVPTTCSAQSATSGVIADGCGGTLFCGDAENTRIGAGVGFSCALRSNGTVDCWGDNGNGQLGQGNTNARYQPAPVPNLANVTSLATGEGHACVSLADGTVRCWGYNGYGQVGDSTTTNRVSPVQVSGINTAVAVTAGRYHSCARLTNGTARCWGYNGNGQLGDNSTTNRLTPAVVATLNTIVGISGGQNHTCAVLSNGLVKCWGVNGNGQLGNGTTGTMVPQGVPGITTAIEVVASMMGNHSCAVLSDGTMRCWGYNAYGQLGDGSTTGRTTPVAVSNISTAMTAFAGANHTCAALWDGSMRCWGYNNVGQLGDGTTTNRSVPTLVTNVGGAIGVTASTSHTCAILGDGSAMCWGSNDTGELGDQSTYAHATPAPVYSFPCTPTTCSAQGVSTGVMDNGCGQAIFCGESTPRVSSGQNFSCAILTTGVPMCWGTNANGQLGNGSTVASWSPVPVTGITTATAIATGESHACALLANGQVRCWGYNGYGQLGDASSTQRLTPVTASGISNAVAITTGRYHTCARLADGTARCWGYNGNYQLGDGTSSTRTSPTAVVGLTGYNGITGITAGDNHTCALLTGGSVRCWGYNGYGQLGDGTTGTRPTSANVPGVFNAVDLMAASLGNHTCAVLASGSVRCWGDNSYGQLGDNTTSTRYTSVAVVNIANAVEVTGGNIHTCARLADNTVRCWGYNGTGGLGDGSTTQRNGPVTVAGLANVTQVSAGYRHTCASISDGTTRCWGNNTSGEIGDETTIQRNNTVLVSHFPCTAGTSNSCTACVPTSCSAQSAMSGVINDNCGGTLHCGAAQQTRIGAGVGFSCALRSNGTVDCWGDNANGQLGQGNNNPRYQPATVPNLTNVTSVATGEGHACVSLVDGTVRCWGYNGYGQLGDGGTTTRSTPVGSSRVDLQACKLEYSIVSPK